MFRESPHEDGSSRLAGNGCATGGFVRDGGTAESRCVGALRQVLWRVGGHSGAGR